jgi:DNA-binding transcriptional regulator/RsmH inhibitor MraZ
VALLLGNAFCTVTGKGKLVLPARLRTVLTARASGGTVIVARHPVDPCLRLHDHDFAERIDDRLRAREDMASDPFGADSANRRRLLAFAEEEALGVDGGLTLSPMMRAQGRIGDHVMLVCTGDTVEVWNPAVARATGDELLVALADHYQPLATT